MSFYYKNIYITKNIHGIINTGNMKNRKFVTQGIFVQFIKILYHLKYLAFNLKAATPAGTV